MLSKTLMFLVWALVAGSSVFWGFKLMAQPLAVPAHAAVATQAPAAVGDLSGLLGVKPLSAAQPVEAAAPPPQESSRFQLIGVVAARHAERAQGVALIAVVGKLPRAYRVGAVVDQNLVLQSVQARAVSIGPRGGVALVSLELPPLPPPTTGVPGATGGVPPGATALAPGGQPGQAQQMQQAMPPPMVAQPGGLPAFNAQQQARFRAGRTYGMPQGAMLLPGGAQPVQDESQSAEGKQPTDSRNLR